MTRQVIRKALAQRPFRRFAVRLTDGRLVQILHDWTTLSTNYPANSSFSFVDLLPAGAACRFYRSVLRSGP
jgi:hypothetical protein